MNPDEILLDVDSEGKADAGQDAYTMSSNLLDGDNCFSFPAIPCTVIEPRDTLMMDAPTPATPAPPDDAARACQAARSRSNSIGQPRPASRRDVVFESTPTPCLPPQQQRRHPRLPPRPRFCRLYPDYWPRRRPRRDSAFDRSRREEELFDEVSEEQRRIASLVAGMTDMDVGRDDRYRGSGQRGGNKRRRDG